MILSPGDDVAKALHALKSGSPSQPAVVLFKPGTYVGGALLQSLSYVTLTAQGEVILLGSQTRGYGLKLDGCSHVTIQGLVFQKSLGHGCFAVNTNWLTWDGCRAEDNVVNGFLTGSCTNVTAKGCKGLNNGKPPPHGPQQGHGLYYSEHGSVMRVEGGTFQGNHSCGIQCNGHPGGIDDLQIKGVTCAQNGNAGIQLAAVQKGVIAGNRVDGNRQPIVLWDDGSGSGWACRDVDLMQQDGQIHVSKRCRDIRTKAGAAVPI